MEKGISFEDFIKKFPECKIEKFVPVYLNKKINTNKKEILEFGTIISKEKYGTTLTNEHYNINIRKLKNNWVFNYYEPGSYSEARIYAFYFLEELVSTPLNLKYNNYIEYADLLTDTSFKNDKDIFKESTLHNYLKYDSLGILTKCDFIKLDYFYKPMGMCSQDPTPRIHLRNVVESASKAGCWVTFIRAYLDLLNDFVPRMSDNSNAVKNRPTYIKELEAINVKIVKLFIGSVLNSDNLAKNHYYGSIIKFGKAIAASAIKNDFIAELSKIIEDATLDNYNRIIAYYFVVNIIYNIEDTNQQIEAQKLLSESSKKLPEFILEILNNRIN